MPIGDEKTYRYQLVLVLLTFTAMMTMFVEMMLVPALPVIARQFPGYDQWIPWLFSVYLLVGAVFNPIMGKLGDMHGRKKILIITMCIYALGLIGCCFSTTFEQLLLFRAVQGIGLAMFPLAYGIIRDTFPREKVPVAIGLVSAMFSVGVSIGLLCGGWIVSVFNWQYCYYIVTPLFLVMIPFYIYYVQDGGVMGVKRDLDVAGALLLSTAIITLLLALTLWESYSAGSWTIAVLSVLAVLSLLAFIKIERGVSDPLIKLTLLSGKGKGAHLTSFVFGIAMFMLFQILPYFLSTPESLGGFGVTDTFQIGLIMLPVAVMGMIVGPMAGRWCRCHGSSRILATGMGVFSLGILFMILAHGTILDIIIGISLAGIGNALVMVSVINVVVETTPPEDFGIASGMNTLFRVIGGSIGPVLGTSILAGFAVEVLVAPGITMTAYSIDGYVWTWVVAFIVMVIGTVAAFKLRTDKMGGEPPSVRK